MGPKQAYRYLLEAGTIEGVLQKLEAENRNKRKKPWVIPETFDYERARDLFFNHDVNRNVDELKDIANFKPCDFDTLRRFLITHKGFAEK